ncbi:hypothetical protein AgCh_039721 [Apium graveolens]
MDHCSLCSTICTTCCDTCVLIKEQKAEERSSESIALTKIESEELELPLISFDFIEKATNSFSHNNKLGEGDHESNHIEFDTNMLMELLRREKDLGIEPDDDLDTFVKSIALGDQRTGLVVDYIMKIVGIDDLKKEVDKRGKDEAITSRTSQSSPRETARKGGIFRKQDIDRLFMEVSQDNIALAEDVKRTWKGQVSSE